MSRFNVPEINSKKDSLFYDALCTQLEYLVEVRGETAEDIVASEYIRLLKEFDPQCLEDTTIPLLMDLSTLGLIMGKIRDLAKMLEKFDFEQGDSSIRALFECIVDINSNMPNTGIEHKTTKRALQNFYIQQNSFMQFLSSITTVHDYKTYSHSGNAVATEKDVVYTVNTIQSMRKSLYSAISNIFHAENILKEDIMLLKGCVPIEQDYMNDKVKMEISKRRLETDTEDKQE
jgi:hypothetical protein